MRRGYEPHIRSDRRLQRRGPVRCCQQDAVHKRSAIAWPAMNDFAWMLDV